MDEPTPPQPPQGVPPGAMKVHAEPGQMAGLYANAATVKHSRHEFTLDFLRCDFDDAGRVTSAVLVQRINMSPLFVTQLITALQDNWTKYAAKSLPPELRD